MTVSASPAVLAPVVAVTGIADAAAGPSGSVDGSVEDSIQLQLTLQSGLVLMPARRPVDRQNRCNISAVSNSNHSCSIPHFYMCMFKFKGIAESSFDELNRWFHATPARDDSMPMSAHVCNTEP